MWFNYRKEIYKCRLILKSGWIYKKKDGSGGYREVDIEKFKFLWELEFLIKLIVSLRSGREICFLNSLWNIIFFLYFMEYCYIKANLENVGLNKVNMFFFYKAYR